jgi:hypothetical protein
MKTRIKTLLCLSFNSFLLFSCSLNQNNNSSNDSSRMDDIEYVRDMYYEYFGTYWINKG